MNTHINIILYSVIVITGFVSMIALFCGSEYVKTHKKDESPSYHPATIIPIALFFFWFGHIRELENVSTFNVVQRLTYLIVFGILSGLTMYVLDAKFIDRKKHKVSENNGMYSFVSWGIVLTIFGCQIVYKFFSVLICMSLYPK